MFKNRRTYNAFVAIDSLTPEQRMKMAASTDVASVIEQYDSRIEGHYNEELTTSRIQYGENVVSNHNTHVILKRLYHAFVNIFIISLVIIDIIWLIPGIGYEIGDEPDLIYFYILTTLIVVTTRTDHTTGNPPIHRIESPLCAKITMVM